MPNIKILLDVDGVLADFVGEACRHFGMPEIAKNWPSGEYNVAKVLQLPATTFWDALGGSFWTNIPKTTEADEIVKLCGPYDTCLLTSPPLNPYVAAIKIRWISKMFPQFERKFLIGPAKEFCAAPNHILIDDNVLNVIEFGKAGGNAILVPRPWNDSYALAHGGTVPTIKWHLEYIVNRIERS